MKMHKISLLLLMLLSISCLAFPQPSGYVNDFADVLSPEQASSLNARLADFERNTTIEIAVVTIPSFEGSDIDTYAVNLFADWKIGKKQNDNGLLLLIAPNEKRWRFEAGYGLEGLLNDAKVGRIGRDVMSPYFKENDFAGGINSALDAILPILSGQLETVAYGEDDIAGNAVIALFIVHSLICLVCFNAYVYYKKKKKKKTKLLVAPWVFVLLVIIGALFLGLIIAGIAAIFLIVMTLIHLANAFGKGGVGGPGIGGFGGSDSSGGFGGFGGGGSGGGGASGGW